MEDLLSSLTAHIIFYGENKEKTDGKNGIWTYGIRAYSSKDLYNWEDRGLIIPPDLENMKSSLHPSSKADRPHIIYNKNTKKYVCWIKIMHPGNIQTETVLTADHFLGPYTLIHEGLRPLGMSAGDFDLAVAPDGKSYYYFERVHSETICADLTPDYTNVSGYYSTHFPHHEGPPYVREATAHFMRNNKHYLITSGTTGYIPNPSEVAIADTWHGPFTVLGNPHPNDKSETSYHSQISSVFKVHGKKDLYIACADRWLPKSMDIEYSEARRFFEMMFDPMIKASEKQTKLKAMKNKIPRDALSNTSIADYVWLPLRFEKPNSLHPLGMVYIDWYDQWRHEDYQDE